MNNKYVAQAPTQEEAIDKGLKALGITREEAIIKVDNPGKKGFLGFGQKDAVVTVEKREKTNVVDEFLTNELNLDSKRKEAKPVKVAQKEEKLEEAAFADRSETDPVKEKALEEEAEMDKEEKIKGRDQAEVELVGEKQQTQTEVDTADYSQEESVEDSKSTEPTEEEIQVKIKLL